MNLSPLQELYGHTGPFVSVHLDVSRNTEDARQQLEARWTTARDRLEHGDVDEKVVQQIGERLLDPVDLPGDVRRTLVAADGDIVFDEALAGGSPWPEVVTCGELPDLSGWLHQADGQMPFMLVVADREGADIDFYRALTTGTSQHTEVDGSTLHIHKFHGGGWSHRRFQQRSENTAEDNARAVAEEVRSLVSRHRPRVVVLAGEEGTRSVIHGRLEGVPCEVAQVGSGARNPGASEDALWDDVRRLLARLEAEDQQALTDRLEEKWAQGSGAVLGSDEVLRALVQGKVETLVLDLEKAHETAVDPSRFPGLPLPGGAAAAEGLPADQVLVAAGAATDARLAVLPAEQGKGGGVAALLRWDV